MKGRKLFAPIYEYSGKLSPEEQKRFAELITSIASVVGDDPSATIEYALPKRESLRLEAHQMTLYRNNPELLFISAPSHTWPDDVAPYRQYCSIRAVIAKTELADLPIESQKLIGSHLETLTKRLTKNSVEVYIQKVKKLPHRPKQKTPPIRFGIASAPGQIGGGWVLEADGSFVLPEGAKRGVIQITDVYGNEYAVDLDDPKDAEMTENTAELYAEIDRVFETLTDTEFQRLSGLNKADLSAEIEKLFLSE